MFLRMQAAAARTDHVGQKGCLTVGDSRLHPGPHAPRHCICLHAQTHTRPSWQHIQSIQEWAVITQPAPHVAQPDQPWDHGWLTTAQNVGSSIQWSGFPMWPKTLSNTEVQEVSQRMCTASHEAVSAILPHVSSQLLQKCTALSLPRTACFCFSNAASQV